MPISQTDQLFTLIKSLTKAEKRNFKLYAKRIQSSDSLKFIQLFDILEKQDQPDEDVILDKLADVKKSQLSNLKRHLYTQILKSLRLIYLQKNTGIQIREHIDYSSILYGKGLYLQSLKILERARKIADKNGFELLSLSIIEYQKLIESRHITRTGPLKNEALAEDARKRIGNLNNTILLSNLRLILHGYYIKNGHIKNQSDLDQIQSLFEELLPHYQYENLGFFSKIYLYQSFVWYYHIVIDFIKCYEFSLKWVELFKKEPKFIDWDPDLFMRGYHYLLTSAYNNRDVESFNHYLDELEKFRKSYYSKFNTNSKIISFLYVHTSRLNKYFLEGSFDEGVKILSRTTRRLSLYRNKLDSHRILVFYYKIAWMYFCNQEPNKAIEYLHKIINLKMANLREDIQGYGRLLFLMAHFEMGNYHIFDYLVKSVNQFFARLEEKSRVQECSVQFFKKISKLPLGDHHQAFKEFKIELLHLKQDLFEHRAFIYLDILSWCTSKIEKKNISEVIKEKNLQKL